MMPLSVLTSALRSTCLELIPLVCLWKHLYKLYTSFLNDGKDSPMNTSRHEFVCMNVLFIYLNYFIFFQSWWKIGKNKITFSVRLKNCTFLEIFFCFKLLSFATIMFFRYAVRNFIIYNDGNFSNLYRSNNVYFLFMFCLYQFHRICLLYYSVLKINFQILPGCQSSHPPTNIAAQSGVQPGTPWRLRLGSGNPISRSIPIPLPITQPTHSASTTWWGFFPRLILPALLLTSHCTHHDI